MKKISCKKIGFYLFCLYYMTIYKNKTNRRSLYECGNLRFKYAKLIATLREMNYSNQYNH